MMTSQDYRHIGPVVQVEPGLFTAEATTSHGEKFYLGFESLEKRDSDKWESYKFAAKQLTLDGLGVRSEIATFIDIGSLIHKEALLKRILAEKKNSEYWTSDPALFEQLRLKLEERNIKPNTSKAAEMKTIPRAMEAFMYQTHMVYALKVPITGRIEFDSDVKNFAGYRASYGNLIMSVGTNINEVVENRGIFRNPLSVVEGGYAGLAMMLHSFTCMVVQNNFPEVEEFKVRPLRQMVDIILNSVPKDKITINGIRGDLYDSHLGNEPTILIPIKVLVDPYNQRNSDSVEAAAAAGNK